MPGLGPLLWWEDVVGYYSAPGAPAFLVALGVERLIHS